MRDYHISMAMLVGRVLHIPYHNKPCQKPCHTGLWMEAVILFTLALAAPLDKAAHARAVYRELSDDPRLQRVKL